MGSFRLAKSVKLGKGVRLNLSKSGVGISAGVRGARYSVHSSGRRTTSVGIPGSGMSYRNTSSRGSRGFNARRSAAPEPLAPVYPKAGALAPKAEKIFVRGVTAYMQDKLHEAFASFGEVQERDTKEGHIAEEFFMGMCLIGLGRQEESIPYLEAVLASDHSIPDPLMTKYGVAGDMVVGVTPVVSARVPMSNLATALMLAEIYQHTNQPQKAINLLESLGSQAPNEPVFGLSLADLYDQSDNWEDVVRVTEGVLSNEDDVTLNILVLRAFALNELGMTEAALTITKECLRTKKRSQELLHLARYVRGRAYESAGKAGMARKEYERIFAEDSKFMDVSVRLGEEPSSASPPPRPDL